MVCAHTDRVVSSCSPEGTTLAVRSLAYGVQWPGRGLPDA